MINTYNGHALHVTGEKKTTRRPRYGGMVVRRTRHGGMRTRWPRHDEGIFWTGRRGIQVSISDQATQWVINKIHTEAEQITRHTTTNIHTFQGAQIFETNQLSPSFSKISPNIKNSIYFVRQTDKKNKNNSLNWAQCRALSRNRYRFPTQQSSTWALYGYTSGLASRSRTN